MLKDTIYVQTFSQLGENTDVSQTTLQTIKPFVCHMYGWNGFDSVDEIRYRMYCKSGGKIACQQLPPCTDVLELYVMWANYQARIWRKSLAQHQNDIDPLENGCFFYDDGALSIKWMRSNPAPEEVTMQLFSTNFGNFSPI